MQKERQRGISNLQFTFLQVHLLCQHLLTESLRGLYVTKSFSFFVDPGNTNRTLLWAPHSCGSMASSGGLPKSLMSRVFTVLYKLQVQAVLAGAREGAGSRWLSLLQPGAGGSVEPLPLQRERTGTGVPLLHETSERKCEVPVLPPWVPATLSCCVLSVKTKILSLCSWGRS